MKKLKVAVSKPELILMIAALKNYGASQGDYEAYSMSVELSNYLGAVAGYDSADDGPEVDILRFPEASNVAR